jgi:hypothetical protein
MCPLDSGRIITGLPFTLSTEFGGVGLHYLVAFFSGSTQLGGVPYNATHWPFGLLEP